MKHRATVVIVLAAILALSVVLSGCQKLGINAPSGMPSKKTAQVSSPAVAQDGVLRVGVNADNAPFSTEVDGRMVGIDVDIAAAVADELGLSVEYVDVGTEGESALSEGTVDIIMGRDTSDSASSCWLSDPYLETAVALFATSSGAIMPKADSKPKIEAQESSMSAWEVSKQFGEDALESVSDLKTAFEDLSSGKATYVASDVIIGSYINRTSGINAQIIGLLQKPGGYSVGVSASNNDLKMAVSNAVDTVYDTGIAALIQQKWIGTALNLDDYQLSEAAEKAVDNVRRRDSADSSKVGSNAVDLSDDGSSGQADSNAAVDQGTVIDPGYTYTEPVTDYSGYTEPVYTEPTYTEPAPAAVEEPVYTEPVVDTSVEPAADASVDTSAEPAADTSVDAAADAAVDTGEAA